MSETDFFCLADTPREGIQVAIFITQPGAAMRRVRGTWIHEEKKDGLPEMVLSVPEDIVKGIAESRPGQ